ncbi:MAG: alanine racemase [Gammaproteobacteria bacterium]|nr:alanine racemase [Gammaproteobacteria bacterium]
MQRLVKATIDLRALRRNFAHARRRAGRRQVWPVVKADAYGHGMLEVVRALADADGFCVADLDEGLALREAGVTQPVLVIQGAHSGAGLAAAVACGLTLGVHGPEQLALIEKDAPKLPAGSLRLWLKIETGMRRLGLEAEEALEAQDRLSALAAVAELGMMTHFACADTTDHPLTDAQITEFGMATLGAKGPTSVCNSAALLTGCYRRDTVVRPGIMLYGASPLLGRTADGLKLAPVMTLRSRVLAVKEVPAGHSVGYGAAWTASENTRIGIVAAGYGDGYPRHAPSGTPVRIGACDVHTLGRVSMDSLTVDLRLAAHVRVGDEVVLWGRGLPVDQVATAAGTIGYELLTGVSSRVPREYLGGEPG